MATLRFTLFGSSRALAGEESTSAFSLLQAAGGSLVSRIEGMERRLETVSGTRRRLWDVANWCTASDCHDMMMSATSPSCARPVYTLH